MDREATVVLSKLLALSIFSVMPIVVALQTMTLKDSFDGRLFAGWVANRFGIGSGRVLLGDGVGLACR